MGQPQSTTLERNLKILKNKIKSKDIKNQKKKKKRGSEIPLELSFYQIHSQPKAIAL